MAGVVPPGRREKWIQDEEVDQISTDHCDKRSKEICGHIVFDTGEY